MFLTLTHSTNKYESIDESSLTSAASEIREAVSTNNGNLNTLNGELMNDSIWKANARTTLETAFGKLSGEVTQEIEDALKKVETVAKNIKNYKEYYKKAKEAADEYNRLEATHNTNGTPQTNPNYQDNSSAMQVQKVKFNINDPLYCAADLAIRNIVGGS